VIGFGCTYVRKDFLTKGNQNYSLVVMVQYGVSVTFNVVDLTLFDTDFDSRSNPFEERGDDVEQKVTLTPYWAGPQIQIQQQ
jgi:hypothetical protein